MKTDLTIPCLIFMIITIYLYYHSKTSDKYLLSIMIFGQFILLFGSIIKNDNLIEIAHILFTLTIIFGVFFLTFLFTKINN